MYVSNVPGLIGVALAVALGFLLNDRVPPDLPFRDGVRATVPFLFLGLYGLTLDRCEVPGLFASYRANVRDFFYALGIAFGEKAAGVQRTRRLCVVLFPLAFAPLVLVVLAAFVLALDYWFDGEVTRAAVLEAIGMPAAGVVVWFAYALATRRLRLRKGGGYGGMSFS